MNPGLTRLLLICGFLGAAVFLAGDLAFLGTPASGSSFNLDRVFNVMARVPTWRLYAGALAAPLGAWLELLGMLGLWCCARPRAPRMAGAMLACLYTFEIVGLPVRCQFAPAAFALRFCGSDGDAVRHLMLIGQLLTALAALFLGLGLALWILLTLKRQTGVPVWTVVFTPIVTLFLWPAMKYVPAPLGFSLTAGWNNLVFVLFFAVLALTFRGGKEPAQ